MLLTLKHMQRGVLILCCSDVLVYAIQKVIYAVRMVIHGYRTVKTVIYASKTLHHILKS